MSKLSPFDYLNSINSTKKNIMIDAESEKSYNGFMINRGLSYFVDTVLLANEMNIHHNIDSRLQYDFFINSVRSKKRFSKWFKAESNNSLSIIKEYYGYSNEKAKQVLKVLNENQINELKAKVYTGGKSK